uniref:Uncharacterized protein n=1 Tax=Arundo donax TaxID=35708 RepID=A0A0A8YX17_ARUDO
MQELEVKVSFTTRGQGSCLLFVADDEKLHNKIKKFAFGRIVYRMINEIFENIVDIENLTKVEDEIPYNLYEVEKQVEKNEKRKREEEANDLLLSCF